MYPRSITSSIYRKIALGFSLVLLLSIIMATVGFIELRNIRNVVEDLIPSITERRMLERILIGIETIESDIDNYSVTSGDDLKERVERDIHEVIEISGAMSDSATDRSTGIAISALADRALKLESAIHALVFRGDHAASQNDAILTVYQRIAALRQSYETLSTQSDRVFSQRIATEQSIIANAITFSIVIETFILGIGTFLALYLSQLLTTPIRNLRETANKIAAGDSAARAKIESEDEIGQLAHTFNMMAERIESDTRDLEEKVADRTRALAEKIAALDHLNKELDHTAELLIKRDVELTHANQRLRELDRVKSEFLSIAAHQLRTPLSAVKWVFSILLEEHNGVLSPDQRNFLTKGLESNERMIHLVDDMLTVTRIESGKLEYEMHPIDLVAIAKDIIGDFGDTAERKHIALTFECPDEHITVDADAEKIRFVFDNLISNAIKYTPEHGAVLVRMAAQDTHVVLTIRDSGIGIPKDQHASVFTKFFRAENAVKTVSDGTGLGLFVVKSIIEKHDGTVTFESDIGAGTEFTVTFPIAGTASEKVS